VASAGADHIKWNISFYSSSLQYLSCQSHFPLKNEFTGAPYTCFKVALLRDQLEMLLDPLNVKCGIDLA
jgi:hypothetical protein